MADPSGKKYSTVNYFAGITFHFQEAVGDTFNIPTDTMIINGTFGNRVCPTQEEFPILSFEARDMNRLASSTGLLNDICINGCTAVLHSQFIPAAGRFSIFSTYDLHQIRYHADDETLWRNTSRTRYWETPVWILPIHRPSSNHWVMCKINLTLKQVDLFDSFAERKPWKTDIKVFFHSCTKPIRLHPSNISCSLSAVFPL